MTTVHLSHLVHPEEYVVQLERTNTGTECEALVIDIRDNVRLRQYYVAITQSDVEQMQTVPTKTVSFLHAVLYDAFHNDNDGTSELHPTVPLTYEVVEPTHPPGDCFVFSVHNTYKYGPFSFHIRVPRQTLSDTENIERRLDKMLTENASLRARLRQSDRVTGRVSEQMDALVTEVRYMRDVERYRYGFVLNEVYAALNDLFSVCSVNWTSTRSFGGLDLACPTVPPPNNPINPTALKYKSVCASVTPTYRSIARRIVDLYAEHNDCPVKSYHLPFKCPQVPTPSGAVRIVHHLTTEQARRVRVRLVVPEHQGLVASVSGRHIQAPYTSMLLLPSNNGDAMECREWILFWNKVDQLWELEEGYVSKATRIQYKTAIDLLPEWRAHGVRHEYDVLEWETDDA